MVGVKIEALWARREPMGAAECGKDSKSFFFQRIQAHLDGIEPPGMESQ